MMNQWWGYNRNNVFWHLEIPRVPSNTTEILEQKKTISWTPDDQATDKTKSSPTRPVTIQYFFSLYFKMKLSLTRYEKQLYRRPYKAGFNVVKNSYPVLCHKLDRSNYHWSMKWSHLPGHFGKLTMRSVFRSPLVNDVIS